MSKIRTSIVHFVAFFLMITLVVSSCSRDRKDSASSDRSEFRGSPNVQIKTFSGMGDMPLVAADGSESKLSDYRGNIVVMCVFATWHKDSPEQINVLNSLREKHERWGVKFIGLVIDDNGKEALSRFEESQRVSFPVFVNGSKLVERLGGLRKIPTTFILLRDGYIYDKAQGKQSAQYFEARLKLIRAQRL